MREDTITRAIEEIDITKPAPTQEPMRQYYYIRKCRQIVQEESKKLGRPLTACTKTFGCQMNARDSEKIVGILEEIGYKPVEDEKLTLLFTIHVQFEKMRI